MLKRPRARLGPGAVTAGLWALGAALFAPLLGNRFIGDDFAALSIFREFRTKPFLETVLYGGNDFFRPLNLALIMARGALFGDAPLPYVIANICLHLANTTLVFMLARRVLKNPLAASASALFFLVAFSHYEAITWISSSVTLFVTLFMLVSVYSHLRFRETSRPGWVLLAVAGFVLAFLTKETAISLPFVILLCDLVLVEPRRRSKAFFLPYAAYGALLLAYLTVQTGFAVRFMGGDSVYRPGWHILTNAADYWVWLWMPNPRHPYVAEVLSVLPRPLLIVYWTVAAATALTLPLLATLAVLKRLSKPLLWSFLGALLSLLVFLPFAVKISARYAYLPSVFAAFLGGGLFALVWRRLGDRGGNIRRWVLAAAGCVYLAANAAGLLLIQREFVRVSRTTERLALEVGELVKLEDGDVVFIENLPPHVHLREAVQWYHNPTVHVHADNDAYPDSPRTLSATKLMYEGLDATLHRLRFEDGGLRVISEEVLRRGSSHVP